MTDSAHFLINAIERVLRRHLQVNLPPEDEIWILNVDHWGDKPIDHDNSNHWIHVSESYLRMLSYIGSSALDEKLYDVVHGALYSLVSIANNNKHISLGHKQRRILITNTYYNIRRLFRSMVKDSPSEARQFPFSSLEIGDMLEAEKDYGKLALMEFAEIQIEAAEVGSNEWFMLNEIGTIGRTASRRCDKSLLNRETVLYVSRVFDRLRTIFEEPFVGDRCRAYCECHSQLESLKEFLPSNKRASELIVDEINASMNRFSRLEEAKEILKSKFPSWPKSSE